MRVSVSRKKARNKKYVDFHRNWKRVLNERERRFQYQLRNEHRNDVNESEPTSEVIIDEMQSDPLRDQLKSWVVQNQISMRCVDGLLNILRTNGHTELPKSYRTLLSTPRNIQLTTIGESKYWYRGLVNCLKSIFFKLDRNLGIELKFNIDGLPIFNSSQIQFWPILASIDGENYTYCKKKYFVSENMNSYSLIFQGMPNVKPMVISIWCGLGKPILSEFLNPFVSELNDILSRGIEINNYELKVGIKFFVCDSPARAFLKGIRFFNKLILIILNPFLNSIILTQIHRHCVVQPQSRMPEMYCDWQIFQCASCNEFHS